MGLPLVSCLMLTYSRLEMFKHAYDSYIDQTYRNKELIIVNSGTDGYKKEVSDYVGLSGSESVTHITCEPENLGKLRNMALDASSGEYLMTMDDDDSHHKKRIEKQMDYILREGKEGCLLGNFRLIYGDKRYVIKWAQGLEPTLLCKKIEGIRYDDELSITEDTDYIRKLKQNKVNVGVYRAPSDFYEYRYHGGNVTPGETFIKFNPQIAVDSDA